MPVNTQTVGLPTYVKHDDLDVTYSGDKQHVDDYDVTTCMHPFDGVAYRYVPEERNWEPSVNVAWVKVRAERDKKIEAFCWKLDRERDLVALNLSTAEQLAVLLSYVQALRDIPQTQTDPLNIVWPIDPTLPPVEEPAPVVEKPMPVADAPVPVAEGPVPDVEEVVPGVEEVVPVVEEAAPVIDENT